MRPPLPPWLYPGPAAVAAALLLAHVLDAVYPFHRGVLLRVHPVHTAFHAARRLAPPGSSRRRGAAAWLLVVGSHLAAYAALLRCAWLLGEAAWVAAAAWIYKVSFSLRLLLGTVRGVAACGLRGDWGCARGLAQGLVRRNVYALDEGHVVSAAVESLAESLVDGYTSPLLYGALLGPLGALAQRLVNTLDGALGFKTPEYLEAGWLSAKADTVVNYPAARLTALAIAAAALLLGMDWRGSLAAWRRWSGATESRNAGHPMAAVAGALGVRLEKPGAYSLGDGRLPGPRDAAEAVRLAAAAAAAWLSSTLLLLAAAALA